MEFTNEQKLFSQVVQKAWDNDEFKRELISNPIAAIEKETGEALSIPNGTKIVVRDQTDESTVFINIPSNKELEENVELSDSQLESVSAGKAAFTRFVERRKLSPLHGCFTTVKPSKIKN